MATSMKTVAFAFPRLAAITNNTLTNFSQITVTLPEGSKVFKSCFVEFSCNDIITATGGTITTKTAGLRLGAAAYTSIANSNTITNSGENIALMFTQDYTAHFTTNWTGTSMTCDFQVQINQSTGTTLGMVDGGAILYITYEYDDTSATQVKTVWIPFTSRLGALATTKTAFDTLPALDTFCAEGGKTYLNHGLLFEGNENLASTNDFTISFEFDSAGVVTSANHERALASDRFVRQVDEVSAYMTPAASRVLNIWLTGTTAVMHTMTATFFATYTFTLASTTRMTVSLRLPMEMDSPIGGTTTSDAQRASRDLYVPEPGTITTLKSAVKFFWTQSASIGNLYVRSGSQAYNTYTQNAAMVCGGCCLQRTVDDNITLARGKNTLSLDAYRSTTTVLGWSVCALWYMNYQCDVPSEGVGAANKTAMILQRGMSTTAAVGDLKLSAAAISIPEADYFINSIGTEIWTLSATFTGTVANDERLAAEGGPAWEQVVLDAAQPDGEVGVKVMVATARSLYKRWPNDPDGNRIDLETARRRQYCALNLAVQFWVKLATLLTYHSVLYSVAGSVTGSDAGTVTIDLIRGGEKVRSTSRVGDGAYSISWYPDGQEVYTVASDATGNQARSVPETAL